MTVHLLVIGQRASYDYDDTDADIEAVAEQVKCPRDGFVMKRCRSPSALARIIQQVAAEEGMIETLDFYDHASRDHIIMGDGRLFDVRGSDLTILRKLGLFLTKDARIRLLGCETALGAQGQQMLRVIRQELGGSVVVYGTLGNVTPDLFDGGIFLRSEEERWLFSSTEADARLAPSWQERQIEIDNWLRAVQSP